MPIDTRYRTSQEEIMDDFALEGDVLRDALDKIAAINHWLGGNKITIDGIKQLLKDTVSKQVVSVVDIGCGNGDMCRAIADFGQKTGIAFDITGIDANPFTISHAMRSSRQYANISYQVMDIFSEEFARLRYDIAVCTLTLHHFADEEIIALMRLLTKQAGMGVVINDLQRSALAYRLFQLVCFVFRLNPMSREDGLTSILRGFKKQDLQKYARQLQLENYTVNWRWAFRYQWIISNI